MRVVGFGLRESATVASLHDVLAQVGGPDSISAVATLADKSDLIAIKDFQRATRFAVVEIPREAIAGLVTTTLSPRINEAFETGSVAEAVALVAAGPGARLIATRAISSDGLATAAIAEGPGP
jgi:cobalt-precorrin 5A hydrolase